MKFSFLRTLCGGVLICAVVISCSRKSEQQGKGRGAPPVSVLVAKAETKDVPVEIQAIGTVQAFSTVAVRSQITGPIFQVHIEEGQDVKAGDLLFTIDQRPFQGALSQAQSNLKRDEAQMVNARLNFERTSNLFASKIASQQDFDTAEAAYLSAKATVLADGATVTNAMVNLSYTTIRAAIDGRTGNMNVKKGNVVKAPDDVLLTIAQIHPIYVTFSVPEQNLPVIRRRMNESALSVKATVPTETNDFSFGQLSFIDNNVDTNSGTILLKGTFSNTNTVLWPGQFVEASLMLSNITQATVVPSHAVQSGQSGPFVFVVKPDATVEARTNIATGITREGLTVITTGLKAGEEVVTDGQLRLTPGAKVSVKGE